MSRVTSHGSIMVLVLLTTGTCQWGCATFVERESADATSWVAVADAIDEAEQHNLRRSTESDPPSKARAGSGLGDPLARPVTRQEIATAKRLLSRTSRRVHHMDRLTAAPADRADSLDKNRMLEALGRSVTAPRIGSMLGDGALLRTDFSRASDQSDDALALLTLSEMADTTSEGAKGDAGSGAAAPAKAPPGSQPGRGPLPGFRQTVWRDVRQIHLDLWEDTKRVYTNPTNVVVLLVAGGTSLALRGDVDDDIEDYYDDHHTLSEGWRDTFGVLGNPGFHFALAGAWYLAGQQMQDTKTYEVAKTLFSALIINGVSTSALKLCANTDSPNGEALAWPSGHTSSAFTVASVMHQAYGHWVGIPLYGVAGMVGLARLDDREHHFSDVVFGAAMGLVIGHTVAGGHRPQIFGGDLIPYADPATGTGGIAWFKSTQ